jgi:hypothetical protein
MKRNATIFAAGVAATLSLILLLDAHAEKYELQDQDWRKQKPWYQPKE